MLLSVGYALLFLAAANPCSNGSFEDLGADGVPVDWSPMGHFEVIEYDVHTGQRALRLVRPEDDPNPETGLNRAWEPNSGQRGAMIERVKGGAEFYYKVSQAAGKNMRLVVIPMEAIAFEGGGARREFVIPEDHVGDGQWHRARFKFDYSDAPEVKWVHIGARISGGAGELLLDSIRYLDETGPVLNIQGIRIEESERAPGEACTVFAAVANLGDQPAERVRFDIEVPDGMTVSPGFHEIASIPVDGRVRVSWRLAGRRADAGVFHLNAASGEEETLRRLVYAPQLELINFGPLSPVAAVGEAMRFECVVRNTGNAIARGIAAEFVLPSLEQVIAGGDLPPGAVHTIEMTFTPEEETAGLLAGVTLSAENCAPPAPVATRLVVGRDPNFPPATGARRIAAQEETALIENEGLRLLFGRHAFGFGPAELWTKTAGGWRLAGVLPRLGTLAYHDSNDDRVVRSIFAASKPEATGGGLRFSWRHVDRDGAQWDAEMTFLLDRDTRFVKSEYTLRCDQDRDLRRFDGPMVYVLDRGEAIFPGCEWIVDEEVSSSTLEIEEGHEHHLRYVPHQNMVTLPAIGVHGAAGTCGVLWDIHQRWDGQRGRPAAVFASPDRFNHQRGHLVGVQLPSVPEFLDPNTRIAERGYPLKAGQALTLTCRILADGAGSDALAAIDAWFATFGCPEPAPLPRGNYAAEIGWSMEAYFASLWDEETEQWWSTKNGHPIMSYLTRPQGYLADLLTGAILSPDADRRAQCRAFAERMAAKMGIPVRLDAARQGQHVDFGLSQAHAAAGAILSAGDDGLWRFDADREAQGVFKGIDYHDLGEDNAVAVGTVAAPARRLLRYARMTGEQQAFNAALPALEYMEQDTVPRAAQVWEVPFHAPDILAAADAVDAYLDAYRLTGDQRWLDDAVAWARRGLPFVYFWQDPEKPYVLGGSIPVFGATFFTHSWFGRSVQWNGLRYANALLSLDEYEQSRPWRQIAELLIRSAIYQQADEGEDTALWPDAISAIDGEKSAWVFSPRQIIRNILKLIGRDEDARTVIIEDSDGRVHINAVAEIRDAKAEGGGVAFSIEYPQGDAGAAVVANLSRPEGVLLDGEAAPERRDLYADASAGWYYDAPAALVVIRIPKDGVTAVRIEGAAHRHVVRLPAFREDLAFDFEEGIEGWASLNDVDAVAAEGGKLTGRITGGDPYLARGMLAVKGDDYPVVVLRLRVSAGQHGQFYWSTSTDPSIDEAKVLVFPVVADGEYHVYRLLLGEHPAWSGQTITMVRVDPANGAVSGGFAIDYLHGEE